MTREELRDALAVLIDVFKNPHGTLTPDYGEICGDGFQMMTMHPDPVAVANALSRLPDILASLDTEAVKAETMHGPECEHPKAPIRLCDCARKEQP